MHQINHPFYEKTPKEQQQFLLKLGLLALLIFGVAVGIAYLTQLYFIPVVVLFILISTIASFIDTPSMRKSGKLTYYSSLFLAEEEKNNKMVIHGGTLFDYYFVLPQQYNGTERTRLILLKYIQGLIELINTYEGRTDLTIKGTSYIINERTAKKIGLKAVKTDGAQTIILLINYIPLTLAYSLSKAKLNFPNLSKIKTYEGQLKDLVEKREMLLELEKRLRE